MPEVIMRTTACKPVKNAEGKDATERFLAGLKYNIPHGPKSDNFRLKDGSPGTELELWLQKGYCYPADPTALAAGVAAGTTRPPTEPFDLMPTVNPRSPVDEAAAEAVDHLAEKLAEKITKGWVPRGKQAAS